MQNHGCQNSTAKFKIPSFVLESQTYSEKPEALCNSHISLSFWEHRNDSAILKIAYIEPVINSLQKLLAVSLHSGQVSTNAHNRKLTKFPWIFSKDSSTALFPMVQRTPLVSSHLLQNDYVLKKTCGTKMCVCAH